MDNQQALQVLVNAVQIANTKGAYTLQESKTIADAVDVFTKPKEQIKEKK